MVDNQHKKITGYRDLSEDEIALMNECKGLATQVGDLVERVYNAPDVDKRWSAIARTHLQEGFMALIRSVARPTTF